MSVKQVSVQLGLLVVVSGAIAGATDVKADEADRSDSSVSSGSKSVAILRVRDRSQPATTVKQWVAQIEAAQVQVTGVKLERTEEGLDIVLETAEGKPLQVDATKFRREENSLIADIPNAVLVLPQGQTFVADNPATDIASVRVEQQAGSNIRVSVAGNNALPKTEVTLRTGGLAYSLNPEDDEADDEIVVTGQREGYRAPNASTATKTDTPIRDIPQSIQVVPRQVLQDRRIDRIQDGLENVSGVITQAPAAGSRSSATFRGFLNFGGNFLVNGIPDPQIASDGGFANVERLEVLKGPSSVLFGEGSLSGTVNIITKQPLLNPFYEVSASAGSFNDYRGAIDFSGPVDEDKTVLYRFNAAYRNFGSFLDFHEGRVISIAPNLTVKLSPNTDLVLEGDVNILEQNGQQPEGQPAVGTVLPNPNGRVRRSFNAAGPQTDNLTINGRVGYRFEHRFSESLKLRHAFLHTFYDDDDREGRPGIFNGSLAANNRTLNRRFFIGSQYYDSYYFDTNLLGKFRTGAIEHQLLFGFSLNRNTTDLRFEFGNAAPVDIFNPVFNQTVVSTGRPTLDSLTTRDTLGIYIQDQITLATNLKLLLGGRVDIFEERGNDRLARIETSQSDAAFSPRVGIVYQPIPPISLYVSFARSFTPTIGTSVNGDAFLPERGTQYEVGIKADLNSRLSTTIALYDLTRSNVTTADPNNPFFSVQTGEQRSRGIEFDISGEILPGWNIIAGYAYNIAEVIRDNTIRVGNRLNNAPEHAFNLWTTYRIQTGSLRGLGLGLGFYYIGDRQGDLANTFELPSYFRTDAAIFYERDRFRASLNIRNLFDVEYYASARSRVRVDPGAPFTIQGTVSWQF